MTNDLTTVEGSFQQLIDDLENNLQEKGVDAKYDATTGIRGLVSRILEIEQGIIDDTPTEIPDTGLYVDVPSTITMYYKDGTRLAPQVYFDGELVQSTVQNIDMSTTSFLEVLQTDNTYIYHKTLNQWYKRGLGGGMNLPFPHGQYQFYIIIVYQQQFIIKTINVNILPHLTSITGDLTKYFRSSQQYYVHLVDDDGNDYANQTITFNINEVSYPRTTDTNGIAKLNINIKPGEYTITASYGEETITHRLVILPILFGEDVELNYHDGTAYEVTLLNNETGEPYPDQSINFEINGVSYTRITNELGIAQFPIRVAAGEYTITATYGQASISNTIIVHP